MKLPPHLSSSPGFQSPRIFSVGLLILCCLLPPSARAQARPSWPPVTEAEKAYAPGGNGTAAAVVLFETGDVDDRSGDKRLQTIHRRIKILSAEGVSRSVVQINYIEPGQDLLGLEGRTITAEGRVVPLEAGAIRRHTADGLTEVTFQLPEAAAGSIIEYRYTLRGGSPPALSSWTFQHEVPCFRSTFTWRPNLGRTSHWTLVNADSLHPEVTALTSDVTPDSLEAVRFEIRNLSAVPVEVLGPPEIETRARLVTTYTDFAAPAVDYWDSFADAARQHQELFLSQRENLTAELHRVAPPDDLDARIRLAYDFVQSRIRRIATSGSEDVRTPSTADSVLALGAADDNGCDLLFIAALAALDIAATRSFVVDRDQAFFHREIQSPAQFSRALVAVTPGNGEALFFSPGTPFAPPGVIPWYTQGVTALLAGASGALFAVTPIDGPIVNQTTRTARFELGDKGRLSAAVRVDYRGQPELEARLAAASSKSQRLRSDLESDWRGRMHGAVIDSVTVLNGESKDKNLALDVRCRVEGFGRLLDDRILFNPAALGSQNSNPFAATSRVSPVFLKYPNISTDNVTVTIPAGWKIDALPEPVQFENELGSYRTLWSYDGEHVVYQRTFALNVARVPPENYEALRTLFAKAIDGDRALVALVRAPVRPSKR